ncbi:MAG: NrfD/PsrC family molybdoenzyme membrane anchor subunit [Bacteroidia bacterium]|nr:NrfD/PsrC family molybdoenzyme membrane anchor subunit [Bacteroidia bacterium]
MSHVESPIRQKWVTNTDTYGQVTADVVRPIEAKPNMTWLFWTLVSGLVALMFFSLVGWTMYKGIGTWGLNKTVGWAFDITNFVFWVGIGHAGTLISAVLMLFRQQWRNSINRASEAMTIFAVICAGQFPILHMGRLWLGLWFLPFPNTRGSLWVNFNSPLLWDVFAISTYFSVSLVFWYLGMIPDFATVRDRMARLGRKLEAKLYGVASFGWEGSSRNWSRYEIISLILSGLATPLVLSVHSIVSMDFATSVIPGWHTTIFPPYFVAGAIFSGFGMVQTLMIVTRRIYKLENYITMDHMESIAKIIIATGSLVGLAYMTELFIAWYSGSLWERYIFINRSFGPYWWSYWAMFTCNVVTPQLFWFRKIRTNMVLTFIISIFINIGMWFERFVIIVTSLHRDYLPSSWADYAPTWVEAGIFVGSIGLFMFCFFLFSKYLPVVNMFEVKTLVRNPRKPDHVVATEAANAGNH